MQKIIELDERKKRILEAIVRDYPEVEEFAVEVSRRDEMDELEIQAEIAAPDAPSIAEKLGIKYTDGIPIADKYRQQLESWPQVKDNFEFLISIYNQAFDMLPNDKEFANFAKDKLAR